MTSADQKDAAEIARALLGSISGQELPPQVVVPPPADGPQMQGAADATQIEVLHSAVNPMMPAAANPQVPQPVNPQVPSAAVPEEKRGPVVPDHAASAPLGAGSSTQSNPPVTIHRQLLSRLLRALPIASEGQLQSMLNVFDPRATPPPAAPFPNPPQDARPVHPIHPGGIPQGGVQSNDPLQHLLPQPTRKRSELPTPTPPPSTQHLLRRICTCISLICPLCPGHTHNAGIQPHRIRKHSFGTQELSNSNIRRHFHLILRNRSEISEYKLVQTLQVMLYQSLSLLRNYEMISLMTIFSRRWASSQLTTQLGLTG